MRIATAEAGIKYRNRTDLLAVFDEGTDGRRRLHPLEVPVGAGRLVRRRSAGGEARMLVVNSGNANAFTGKRGRETTKLSAGGGRGRRLPAEAKSSSPRPA